MSDFRHLCNFFSSQYASIVSSKKIPNAPKLGHLRSSSLTRGDFRQIKAKTASNTCVLRGFLTQSWRKYTVLNLARLDYRYLVFRQKNTATQSDRRQSLIFRSLPQDLAPCKMQVAELHRACSLSCS